MISRILIKDYVGFRELELRFERGLSVFTGVSGAGKSVLVGAILAVFGLKEPAEGARIIEADASGEFELDEFGIQTEPINSFKFWREKTARFFINNQAISRKNLSAALNKEVRYLSSRDIDEFDNARLLNILDFIASSVATSHKNHLNSYKTAFDELKSAQKELQNILNEERKIEELREFASFEAEKIAAVSPEIGEFDRLVETKKKLSKKDKIDAAWARSEPIFACESAVLEALRLSDIDGSFFSDAMNELRIAQQTATDFEAPDPSELLDRLEAVSAIVKRYGSEERALEVLKTRRAELEHYDKIGFEKAGLVAKVSELNKVATELAAKISKARIASAADFNLLVNGFLQKLYLNSAKISVESQINDAGEPALSESGADIIKVELDGVNLKNISSGELNRLRLAFIAASASIMGGESGVLILDEIDANLSGKEAASVAEVLSELSGKYQIFAISHLPQLSSRADHHFVVEKSGDGVSSARALNSDERVNELARMISGGEIKLEAVEFAKTLLGG